MVSAASTPLEVLAFLCLAVVTQMCLAFYGLLTRYVQVVSAPPMPGLRVVLVGNCLAEATLLCCYEGPKLLLAGARRMHGRCHALSLPTTCTQPQQRQQQQRQRRWGEAASADGSTAPKDEASSKQAAESSWSSVAEAAAAGDAGSAVAHTDSPPGKQQQEEQEEREDQQEDQQQQQCQLAPAKSTVRAPGVLMRGLTRRFDRWETERPVLRRRLALTAITIFYVGTTSLQYLAPGFVDASFQQLTTQWTPLGIALVQALLLHHRLPRAFWPASLAMLGGTCMVIIPSVQRSDTGGLTSLRSWMGFLMACGACSCSVVYYVLLQGTRHFRFTALQLQHCMMATSIILFTCLSLPIDGIIHTSADGGSTWIQQRGDGSNNWRALSFSGDGSRLIASIEGYYMYSHYKKTNVNNVATWTQLTDAGVRRWRSIASSLDGLNLVAVVGGDDCIYTSANGGSNWTPRTSSGTRKWVAIASSGDGSKLVAAAYYNYIILSKDGGTTWSKVLGAGSRLWSSIASSRDGTYLASVAENDYIYTSANGGDTWTKQIGSGSRNWRFITSSADGSMLAALADDDYVFVSTNGGVTWSQHTQLGAGLWVCITSSIDGVKLAAIESNGFIHTSADGGVSWTPRTNAGSHPWVALTSSGDGTKLAASDSNFIYISDDGGGSWTRHNGR